MLRNKSIVEILSAAEKPGGIEKNFSKKTLIPMKGAEWLQSVSEYVFQLEAELIRLKAIMEEREENS